MKLPSNERVVAPYVSCVLRSKADHSRGHGTVEIQKPRTVEPLRGYNYGGGGTRTPKGVNPADFESAALPVRLRLQVTIVVVPPLSRGDRI